MRPSFAASGSGGLDLETALWIQAVGCAFRPSTDYGKITPVCLLVSVFEHGGKEAQFDSLGKYVAMDIISIN